MCEPMICVCKLEGQNFFGSLEIINIVRETYVNSLWCKLHICNPILPFMP